MRKVALISTLSFCFFCNAMNVDFVEQHVKMFTCANLPQVTFFRDGDYIGAGSLSGSRMVSRAMSLGKGSVPGQVADLSISSSMNDEQIIQALNAAFSRSFQAETRTERIPAKDILSSAIMLKGTEKVQQILALGVKPDDRCLENALLHSNADMVKLLLEHGARPSNKCLEDSLWRGNADVVKLLLEHGAQPSDKCLEDSLWRGNTDMAKLLLEHGAKPSDKYLEDALWRGNVDLIKLLLKHGANQKKEHLKSAVIHDNVEIVKLLLQYGANPFDEGAKQGTYCANIKKAWR